MNNFRYTARVFHSASAVIDRSRKQQSAVAKGLRSILNLWSGISTGLSKIIARVQSNEAYTQYLYESVHFAKQNIFSPSKRRTVPRFYHELTKTVHQSPYEVKHRKSVEKHSSWKPSMRWYLADDNVDPMPSSLSIVENTDSFRQWDINASFKLTLLSEVDKLTKLKTEQLYDPTSILRL